jgi:CubicO group peptidase (beta-lactamase class C family)
MAPTTQKKIDIAALKAQLVTLKSGLDVVAWHDRTGANHKQLLDQYAALGYRTTALSIYGTRNDPRYASVMTQLANVPAQRQFFGLTAAEFQQKFNEMAAQGLGPTIVTAMGPANDPLFAGVFCAFDPVPLTRSGLTEQQFRDLNDQQFKSGAILHSFDAYGTPDDTRYVAVWIPNPSREAWNCDALNEGSVHLQGRFNAETMEWARPSHIAVTPALNYAEMFVDSNIGPWLARANLTSAQYQAEFDQAAANDLHPVCVSAKGSGNDARYAAIFAKSLETEARTFRANGPVTVKAIDDVIAGLLRAHAMRGAALAICHGTRLVYAKGYTLAESAYPDVLPTTPFRQASVSKTFAAMALYQLWQETKSAPDPKWFDQTLQSILKLKTPSGGNPVANFDKITLRHLLESIDGLDQNIVWQSAEAAAAFAQPNLPATPAQLARHGASVALTGKPGDTKNVVYSNVGYFYLSQVVAKLRGASSFEAALSNLLNPLHMTRTRQARSLVDAQAADEAHYHLNNLPVWPTARSGAPTATNRTLVPNHYGAVDYEIFDGCGGLSSAVVDVARLLALLSVRQNNPVFKTSTLDALLGNATTATSTLSGPDAHGYHGFDGVFAVDPANNVYVGSKGGWLPSHQSLAWFTTGGMSYVIAENGNELDGVKYDWLAPVRDIAEKRDWGNADLFPSFNMPAFTMTPPALKILPKGFELKGAIRDSVGMQRTSVLRVSSKHRPPIAQ